MQRIDKGTFKRILILEESDFTKPNLLKGERCELVCIPISRILDDKLLLEILPVISVDGVFFGNIMYYNSLEEIDKFIKL